MTEAESKAYSEQIDKTLAEYRRLQRDIGWYPESWPKSGQELVPSNVVDLATWKARRVGKE